jgi:hypothetical protein
MPDNQYWRDASGRLTFEMFRVPADSYRHLSMVLAAMFDLVPEGGPVTNGYDIAFRDYRRGGQVVELAWDNWTGFTVVAMNPDSEPLVQEIGDWLLKSAWATEQMPK